VAILAQSDAPPPRSLCIDVWVRGSIPSSRHTFSHHRCDRTIFNTNVRVPKQSSDARNTELILTLPGSVVSLSAPHSQIFGFHHPSFAGTMSDKAIETAQALLAAMDTEEPFRLLRTLPGKLEELRAMEGQSMLAEVCDTVPHVFRFLSLRLGMPRGGNIVQPVENARFNLFRSVTHLSSRTSYSTRA
jgi:hypothetical protein